MSEAKDFLTDEEMTEAEKNSAPAQAEGKDFISDEEMSEIEDLNVPGPVETLARRALNAATLNYGPEILAATDIDPTKGYQQKLKEQVEREDLGAMENPTAATLGTFGGIAGSMMAGAPVAKVAKKGAEVAAKFGPDVAKKVAPFVSEVLVNMGMNFAQNPGHDATGDSNETDLRVEQATSPLAVATSVAGPAVGKALEAATDPVKNAVNAIGLDAKDLRQTLRNERTGSPATREGLVKSAREMGILNKTLSTTEGIYERAAQKVDEAGRKIADIVRNSSEDVNQWYERQPLARRKAFDSSRLNFDDRDIARIRNDLRELYKGYGPRGEQSLKRMDKLLESWAAGGGPDLEDLWGLQAKLDDLIRDSGAVAGNVRGRGGNESLETKGYAYLKDLINKAVNAELEFYEKGLRGNALDAYKQARREYSVAKSILTASERKLAREGSSQAGPIVGGIKELMSGTPTQTARDLIGRGVRTMNRAPLVQPSIIGLRPPSFVYGGYRAEETLEVTPMEAQIHEAEIQREEIPPSEKARRLNLLRKYGRVYVGP